MDESIGKMRQASKLKSHVLLSWMILDAMLFTGWTLLQARLLYITVFWLRLLETSWRRTICMWVGTRPPSIPGLFPINPCAHKRRRSVVAMKPYGFGTSQPGSCALSLSLLGLIFGQLRRRPERKLADGPSARFRPSPGASPTTSQTRAAVAR